MTDSRRKGRDGESRAERLLGDRDFTVDDLACGKSGCDLIATKDGVTWAVEVKNCTALPIAAWRRQAIRQRKTGQRWMLVMHLPGTREWLVMRQGERSLVWEEK